MHPGFEEIEGIVPYTVFRYASEKIVMASTTDDLWVTGSRNITFRADKLLKEEFEKEYDCLVIPGGPGIMRLRDNTLVLDLIKRFYREKKLLGAICAAPVMLNEAGVLAGHRYTSHASTAALLPGRITSEPVVEDGNIITAVGPGASLLFTEKLMLRLLGEEQVKNIAKVYDFVPKFFEI